MAWNGGWRSISPTWTPIRITKVVWVTNVVNQPYPWVPPPNGHAADFSAFVLSIVIVLIVVWAGSRLFRIVNE